MISDNLPAVERKIVAELSRRAECTIVHPAEVRVLAQMEGDELAKFAQEHGWRVVSRVGGRQVQFYKDTHARLARDEEEGR